MVANVPLVLMLGMGSSKYCQRDFTVEIVSLSSTENTSIHVSDKQNELQYRLQGMQRLLERRFLKQ
jgi:hypothetical protein